MKRSIALSKQEIIQAIADYVGSKKSGSLPDGPCTVEITSGLGDFLVATVTSHVDEPDEAKKPGPVFLPAIASALD